MGLVNFGLESGMAPQRSEFRAEGQKAFVKAVVKGLDSETVARQHQAIFRSVEQGEREHADQSRERIQTPGAVLLEQHLGIGVGVEDVVGIPDGCMVRRRKPCLSG